MWMGEDLFLKAIVCYEYLISLTTLHNIEIQRHGNKMKNYGASSWAARTQQLDTKEKKLLPFS